MNGHNHYHDAEAVEPEPLNVAFDESEVARILAIAEAYASLCREHGHEPPPDPVRAVLQCCEHLQHTLNLIRAAHDKRLLEAECPGAIQ